MAEKTAKPTPATIKAMTTTIGGEALIALCALGSLRAFDSAGVRIWLEQGLAHACDYSCIGSPSVHKQVVVMQLF